MSDETPTTEAAPKRALSDFPYRLVVAGLVLVLLSTVAGLIALPLLGEDTPSELSSIAMPIITALAAILTPLSKSTQ